MRDELKLIELADRYLRGELNAEELQHFDERMRKNTELREIVEDQRALMRGLDRTALRPAVDKAYRSYKLGKWAPGLGLGTVLLIAAVATMFLWKTSGTNERIADNSDLDQAYEQVLSDTTGTGIEPTIYTINPKKDTTLLTPNGIVLDIPKGAFVDNTGSAITTPVRVTLLEALEPQDIMKAGLSTMSGDTLLETGGMFYIDAHANGTVVKMDPTKPLTAMVPSFGSQKDMMLYEGAKDSTGTVDWRNPKPLKKSLVPVDISTLNFYPPGYEAKLAELGQNVTDKAFKDSLYYSFAGTLERLIIYGPATDNVMVIDNAKQDTTYSTSSGEMHTDVGIDPAKIKSIWRARFNNTNLATKEFEERLQSIYSTCNNELLDLYIKSLDKDLFWCDSLAARLLPESMGRFLNPKCGRVDLPAHAADRLRTFYENNSRAEAEAIRKTQEKFWKEQSKKDVLSNAKRNDHALAENVREGELFQKELEANLDTVYKQLGYKRAPIARSAWVVPVTNTGWWNVDKAVIAATTTRSSMSYTDDKTGKTATLTYAPFFMEIADRASYDELVVYLIPKGLNSYQRMKEITGGFTERLNSIFKYDLFCLGMMGKEQFAFKTSVDEQTTMTVVLQSVDNNDLRQMLRTEGDLERQLLKEASYYDWLAIDKQRKQAITKKVELRNRLLPVVFPCAGEYHV